MDAGKRDRRRPNATLLAHARRDPSRHADDEGRVSFDAPAHFAVARGPGRRQRRYQPHGGAWELGHLSVEPGDGTPLHAIAADKVFYVLAGEVELEVGDEQRSGQPGAVAKISAGVPHSDRNAGEASAELLVITTGGGHLDFLAGMAELVARQAPDPRSIAGVLDRPSTDRTIARRISRRASRRG